MVELAGDKWAAAQKIRRSLVKDLDQIRKTVADGNTVDRLKALETSMARYRLACIETLWLDMEYAATEKVEVALWQAHIFVNSTYRKLLDKLAKPDQVVLKRKVERLYNNYLKVAQFFYKGYIQRLCARYDMPALQRIARSAQLDKMEIPDEDRIDPVATGINEAVTSSCHLALTYMGDLSRYRTLARHHSRNFETALTFYSLANDLMLDSGYGYHQMGLIYLEEKKHVEIVYHFYRALAAEKPHPNAASNLDVEFRDLLRPATPRSQSPQDAFSSWFVRLHAFFHRGEDFSQRAELEEEVLHRFRMAVRADDFGPTLLKMILINICAYQVAQTKITAEWTAAGSRFCQFILSFSVRTIHSIAHVLRSELLDLIKRQEDASQAGDKDGDTGTRSPSKYSPAVAASLPLLRVYMTWLCAVRSDIVRYQAHLEPHIVDMYKTLSQASSSLLEFISDDIGSTRTVSHLLPEDIETSGLKCLNGADLPFVCRLSTDPIKQTTKPLPDDLGDVDTPADSISFTRALDIALCAITLAQDARFPFMISRADRGSPESAQIVFVEDGKPEVANNSRTGAITSVAPTATVVDLTSMLSKLQPSPVATAHGLAVQAPSTDTGNGCIGSVAAEPSEAFMVDAAQRSATHVREPTIGSAPSAAEPEDYAMDNQLYGIVNDFLAPPESHAQEDTRAQDETSYGMHSNTANEVFGSVGAASSPRPASATKKSFPSLPWDYFYMPTPQKPDGPEETSDRPWHRSPHPGETAQGYDSLDDPFPAVNKGIHPSSAAMPTTAGTWNYNACWGHQAGEWKAGSLGNARQGGHAKSPGRHVDSLAASNAQFSTMAFSPNTSSLPPVNSPWGLPNNPDRIASQSVRSLSYGTPLQGQQKTVNAHPSSRNRSYAYHTSHGYSTSTSSYGRGQFPGLDDANYMSGLLKEARSGLGAPMSEESEAYGRSALYSDFDADYQSKR